MRRILAALALSGLIATGSPALAAPSHPAKASGKAVAKAPKVFSSPQKEGTKATCPVTGEEHVIAKDTVHREYKGKHVYFCCPGCDKDFDKDPAKYTK